MTTLRDRPRSRCLAGLGTVALATGVGLLLDRPYDNGQGWLGGFCAFLGLILLSMARQGTRVDPSGIRLVYPFRRRFVPWDHIVCFKEAEIRNPFGERTRKPAALLITGETLVVPGADRIASPLLHGVLFSSMRPATFPVLDRLEKERRNRQHRF